MLITVGLYYSGPVCLTSSWLISSGLLCTTDTPFTSLSSSPTWTRPVRGREAETSMTARRWRASRVCGLHRSYLISAGARSTDTLCTVQLPADIESWRKWDQSHFSQRREAHVAQTLWCYHIMYGSCEVMWAWWENVPSLDTARKERKASVSKGRGPSSVFLPCVSHQLSLRLGTSCCDAASPAVLKVTELHFTASISGASPHNASHDHCPSGFVPPDGGSLGYRWENRIINRKDKGPVIPSFSNLELTRGSLFFTSLTIFTDSSSSSSSKSSGSGGSTGSKFFWATVSCTERMAWWDRR